MPAANQEVRTPRFLTVGEVADLLRLKPRTVYDLVQTGRIPFRKAGRRTIFDLEEVLEWTKRSARPMENNCPVSPFPR